MSPTTGSAGACPRCGIDQAGMLPADAVATIRSLPRRWRAALAVLQEDSEAGDGIDGGADTDAVLDDDAVRDVLTRADGVRARLACLAEAARRIRISERPEVPVPDEPALEPGTDPDRLLDALERAGGEAGEALDRLDGADWERRGRRGDAEVTVLDLAREVAHHGVHELRVVEADLRAARNP